MQRYPRRPRHDPRWDKDKRVEWAVFLGVQGIQITVYVMAPDDATDMELLTAACSKMKRQRDFEEERNARCKKY